MMASVSWIGDLVMTGRHARKLLPVLLGLWAASASASEPVWFLTAEGSAGSSNQTLETTLGPFEYDQITVYCGALGVGLRHSDLLCTQFHLSFVQRGAEDIQRTIFNPQNPRIWDLSRSYLDMSAAPSFRLSRKHVFVSVGIGPRLSVLLDESPDIAVAMNGLDATKVLFGLDPVIALGYRHFYATARYLWDWTHPYEYRESPSTVHVADEVYFIGLGVEIPWLGD